MNVLASRLASLPQRQLVLLAGGILLIVVLGALAVLRAPLSELHTMREERMRYEQAIAAGSSLTQRALALNLEIEKLSRRVSLNAEAVSAEEIAVRTMGELNRVSAEYDVMLVSVVPGKTQRVMLFEETPFDLEVRGSYSDLMVWMQALEETLPHAAVQRFYARRNDADDNVVMQVRVTTYRIVEIETK